MKKTAAAEPRKARGLGARKSGGAKVGNHAEMVSGVSEGVEKMQDQTQTAPSCASPGSTELRKISIEFFHPQARDIFLAASFNDWNPTAMRLTPQGDGKWTLELNLAPGIYEYRLIVDGVWTDDPMSAESAPNPYGGFNSVLRV